MMEAADKILFCCFERIRRVCLNSLTIYSVPSILQQMPITRSALKKLRQDKKRTKYNLLIKKQVRETISAFKHNSTRSLFDKVASLLDTTTKKNIFHPNKVARLKSRLSKLLNKNQPSSAAGSKPLKKRSPPKKKSVV